MTYSKSTINALMLFICITMCMNLNAQLTISDRLTAQESELEQQEVTQIFKTVSSESTERKNLNIEGLNDFQLLEIQSKTLGSILNKRSESLKMDLPIAGKTLTLNLIEADIFSPGFKLSVASDRSKQVPYTFGAHYWGEIDGFEHSLVSISIFKDEVSGVISWNGRTYNLGKLEDNKYHVLYEAQDLSGLTQINCHTDDVLHFKGDGMSGSAQRMDESNCVGIYLETAYDMFESEGSVANVTNFVTAVFTEVSALYANEAISLYINELVVWDVNDPYTATNPGGYLDDFKNELNGNFNGDLAHLLSYDVLGGVAYVDVLCVPSFGYGFSGIYDTYNTVPTYSWTVEVITHELGHNLGSPHTHACAWNGNNTAIDGCGPAAGYSEGCDAALPDEGTIMSYCHLVGGVGIDFNLGFGPQPGDLIRDEVYNASCLTSCVDCPETGDPCNDDDVCTTDDTINALCECVGTYVDNDGDGFCVGEDADDNDPCVPVICPPCTEVTVSITLDNYPEETTWDIKDASGTVVASGGPYGSQPDGSTVTIMTCLEDGCYDFTIYDSYGDGICCGYGNGSYEVTDASGTVLASGGSFGSSETTEICVDSGGDPCVMEGLPCDDGNACTEGETYDANCNCQGGVFQDADGDGVCDADDQCPGMDDEMIGQPCNDNDSCTVGETYNSECGCAGGVYTDADGDGFCVGDDPDDNDPCVPVACPCEMEGLPCDDENACTVGETYDANCNCLGGVFQDADGDGVCDADDQCPGMDDEMIGQPCNDNDSCTVGETYNSECACAGGVYTDADGDGFCVGDDPDDNDPCNPDDSDPECQGGVDCSEISNSDFETGWQDWIDGGSDASVGFYPDYANSGTQCLRLRDNNSTSTASSPTYDFSSATSLTVDFTYIAVSMDNSNEDFWLQLSTNGGVSYETVEEWNLNDEFVNNVREFENVTIQGPFSSNTKIRFRCDASGNSDWVYIDDVVVESCDDGSGGEPTCDDGIQNGDEDGIDCGGSNCEPCAVGCNLENLQNFESGWGIWNDGGSDCRRSINDSQYAFSGNYCVRLRDNSTTSNMFTDDMNLNTVDEVNVTFTYIAVSMDNSNEDFFLEVSTNGGASYTIVEEWNLDDEFVNNVREFDSVNIPGPFTSNTRFRFRCDASTNGDLVYIDDIEIESCTNEGSIVAPSTSSSVIDQSLELTVYPNPLEPGNILNVNIGSQEENVSLTLIDMYGKKLFSDTVNTKDFNRYTINTSELSVGSYLLRIDTKGDYKLQKILIMR